MELNVRSSVMRRALVTTLILIETGRAVNAQQLEPAPQILVFDAVTVVDVLHGQLVPNQRVVITGNRIQTVANASTIEIPNGAHVVDAHSKYLIPGLWDMHFHTTSDLQQALLLANGVTGIRDATPFVPLDSFFRWRREILTGIRAGPPRQLLSIRLDNALWCERRDPRDIDATLCVETGDTADVRRKVEFIRAAGADMIKTYTLSNTMYFLIAAEARRVGLAFGGHTEAPALAASDSGARILDHSTLNTELTTLCFFGETASADACRPIAERFARNSTWWVPTWVIPPHAAGRSSTLALYANADEFVRKFWADSVAYGGFRDAMRRTAVTDRSVSADPLAFIRQPLPSGGTTPDSAGYLYVARQAGLPMMAGTDANGIGAASSEVSPGFSLHTELATYVAEGLTPLEALQTATLNPAKFLHSTDSLGTVAAGKLADLVLLDADPLVDIANTTAIRAVVANGHYYDRAALDRLLATVQAMAKKMP